MSLSKSTFSGSRSIASKVPDSMDDLPNVPGLRRSLSQSNPFIHRQMTLAGVIESDRSVASATNRKTGFQTLEDEGSFESLDEVGSRLMGFSRSVTAFPSQAEAFNDLSGRYSLRSQKLDRVSHTRSLPYLTLDNVPPFVTNSSPVCRIIAYYTESTPENLKESVRSRRVEIVFYLEDSTIEIIEPTIPNSGLVQGKQLKRHQVFKPNTFRTRRIDGSWDDGHREIYTVQDVRAGAQLNIYNRIYTVIDCDESCKRLLEEHGTPFGSPQPFPATYKDINRLRASPSRGRRTKSNKQLGFFEYDRKVLRFYGVWDSRANLFGDELRVRLHYYLADNTMEILPVNTRNNGRDKLSKLLKKTQIMKKADDFESLLIPSASIEDPGSLLSAIDSTSFFGPESIGSNAVVPDRPYHWTDLHIGDSIQVAALNITLIDADSFTRDFYAAKSMPLDRPILLPEPEYPVLKVTIPPHNGFGSEADSLETCKASLMPKAPMKDGVKAKLYQGMVLRYLASLESPKPEDLTRSFIIQVYLEDDTIQIREPPIRNSGHKGGVFLSRGKIESHDGAKVVMSQDIYLGATVEIQSHRFVVHDADEYTLRYMEENVNKWGFSSLVNVTVKLKRREEILRRLILTTPGLVNSTADYEEVKSIFERSGLDLLKQEIVTIFRELDPHHSGSVKITKLLKFLMDHDGAGTCVHESDDAY